MEPEKELIWRELQKIIQAQNPKLGEVTPELRMFCDLRYDSLKTMELILKIEKLFGIEINGEDMLKGKLQTPEKIVDLITERKKL